MRRSPTAGRRHLGGSKDEIGVDEPYSVGTAAPGGFVTRRTDVRSRRVYCDDTRGTTLQKRDAQPADTGPVVEHSAAYRRRLKDPIHQQPSCSSRPLLTIASQHLRNLLMVELLIRRALEW